jgi:hypothetical protein
MTNKNFIIFLAKTLKKRRKGIGIGSYCIVDFSFNDDGDSILIGFDGNTYKVNSTESGLHILLQAINEANLNDNSKSFIEYSNNPNSCRLVLLGEPTNEYLKLKRLIKKHTGETLDINDVSDYAKRKYLCYDSNLCGIGIDFIKKKKFYNTLSIEKCHDEGEREKYIILSLRTRKGTLKDELKLKMS